MDEGPSSPLSKRVRDGELTSGTPELKELILQEMIDYVNRHPGCFRTTMLDWCYGGSANLYELVHADKLLLVQDTNLGTTVWPAKRKDNHVVDDR